MIVLCIDASPGFVTQTYPPFNEGEILYVEQSPFYIDEYLIFPETQIGWLQKRFIPISEIDEMELVNKRVESLALVKYWLLR